MTALPDLDPELEDRLRRGLALLADRTPEPGARRHGRIAAVAAGLVLLAGAGAAVGLTAGDGGGEPTARSHPASPITGTAPEQSSPALGIVVAYDLPRLVAESDRIVVGTVAEVEHHDGSEATGGLAYVLATVDVDESIKGPRDAQVVAFDYDYGDAITADGPQGASFTAGTRVLLFLAGSAGTVHEQLGPPHWQVTGGAQGEYAMTGDEPDAPFTMQDVRRAAAP